MFRWKKRRKISDKWRPFCTQCGRRMFRKVNQYEPYYSSVNGRFKEVRIFLVAVCPIYAKRADSASSLHKRHNIEKIVARGECGLRVLRILEASK